MLIVFGPITFPIDKTPVVFEKKEKKEEKKSIRHRQRLYTFCTTNRKGKYTQGSK